MALTTKTPGVYIEEIQRFPASVAAVPTSIPVFIGYTKQATINGVPWGFPVNAPAWPNGEPTNPIRIESLLQFETIFGGPEDETFTATLTGAEVNISVAAPTLSSYRLYYNMLMYFGNGGGPCYVIAVNDYSTAISAADITAAIPKAEQVDEITMMVIPEAIMVSSLSSRRNIYNGMLAHCAKMQDRFAMVDVEVITASPDTIQNDADDFRNDTIGANSLSYGAAYYPSFKPSFPFSYLDSGVTISAASLSLPPSVQDFDTQSLEVVNNGIVAETVIQFQTAFTINNPTTTLFVDSIPLPDGNYAGAGGIRAAINSDPALNAKFVATDSGSNVTITALAPGVPLTIVISGSEFGTGVTLISDDDGIAPDKVLYNRIKEAVEGIAIELYPSAMMAGIYCAVDSTRGVWKAPANVGVTLVDKLNRNVKDSDQENLNVDPTSGKSIDVIREFQGRGMLVWGARTLDGNSNEWRYINVRRTFLFIEDSCKKATEFVVFEPNDMNTWLRIKGMLSSFLNTLWRDGALAGSKPEQAFFVKVGLGETMTSQDILEGRLIVQIGLAVVRPAEFVILQFEHKLQVS